MHSEEASTFPATFVDVGGYHLAAFCSGRGSPTIVLDAGMGDTSEVWYQVQENISQFSRVCSYDRAGLGQSESGPLPRSSQTIVNELHTLLKQAGLSGPYVLAELTMQRHFQEIVERQLDHDISLLLLLKNYIELKKEC